LGGKVTAPSGRLAFAESRFGLAFGVKGFGGEFAIGFFEQDFHFAFGFFELLLAFAREFDTFFEKFHGVVERKLRGLETADDLFKTGKGVLEVGFFHGGLQVGLFGSGLVHRIDGRFLKGAKAESILR
jgi:hypothetical protein